MKIFYSDYELKGKLPNSSRKGALLKVHFEERVIGYADCHPWEELGDKSLKDQLNYLSKAILTPLTKQCLKHASIDGKARASGLNLLADLEIPSSHRLLDDLDEKVEAPFTACKVKVGKNPQNEFDKLPRFFSQLPMNVSVRLDFNNRIDEKLFRCYLEILLPWIQRIDFVEDPFTFDPACWAAIQKEYSIRLAADFSSEMHTHYLDSHSVTVIKPAVQDYEEIIPKDSRAIVFTSYLDHPLGQISAAYSAATAAKKYPGKILTCGLLSHYNYHANAYIDELSSQGDKLMPPQRGLGFGFDKLLEKENWIELT
jgi:O-succinylbenzoate synthase